jgi:hypothetical protein
LVSPVKSANALNTVDTSATGRTGAGAAPATDGATTAAVRAAPTVAVDAGAGWADIVAADGVATDLRVDPAETGFALSLDDTAASGLTFVTGPVDDECPEPDGFFSDEVFNTPAFAPSVLLSASASVSWPCF